ncbi:ribosome maturation factor RimM [Desulfonatronovibrio hydrogenovorans]|uniref:ribosome maturation factor RimM n=1 Tax=Desulfonatronovibrio hydrogenovorans TaxID=53245 RepID=UPI00048E57C7|nr:ribosome maturation factor RimM [Desulfonatronovibrio hydrogenovorans]
MASTKLIHCGRVLKPHGLKGELCILWFAGSPSFLPDLSRLYLSASGSRPKAFNIQSLRRHKGRVLVVLEGVSGRDLAEQWRGADVLVPRKNLQDSDQDGTYVFELLGSRVFLKQGVLLGTLDRIFDNKGSEVWRIVTRDEQEVLFPYNSQFVLEVDADSKKIVIDPPEGLLEIYGVDTQTLSRG